MYVCMYVCMYISSRFCGAEIITGIPIHCKSYTRCGRWGGRGEGEEEGREEERREWKDEGRGERRAREMKNGDETAGLGRTG